MNTKQLRQKILDLAIRGKLVPQDPNDEPASVLLERVRAEKERLIQEGTIKRDKKDSVVFRGDDKSHYGQLPFEVPESWEWCRFGDICDYGNCENETPVNIPNDAWILDLEDIEKDTGRIIAFVSKAQREFYSNKHIFHAGQVLYSNLRPYLNKVLVAPKSGYCTSEIIPLKFNVKMDSGFVRYLLISNYFLTYADLCSYGVKMPRLGATNAKKALIPLPPLNEQKRISAAIESAFAVIDEIERNKADLQTAVAAAKSKILSLAIRGKLVPQDPNDEPASVLLERIRAERETLIKAGKIKRGKNENVAVRFCDISHYGQLPFEVPESWEWCRLGSIAFYKKGPFGSSITKSMFIPDSDAAIKVYEQKNAIEKDELLGAYFISPQKFEELKAFEVYPDDIIVSCAGTIGETFIMPTTIRRGIINQALMRIMLYDKSMMDFYLLYFDFVLKADAQKHAKGTAIKNIPPFDVLKQFLMPIPPLAEQKRIVIAIEAAFEQLDSIVATLA